MDLFCHTGAFATVPDRPSFGQIGYFLHDVSRPLVFTKIIPPYRQRSTSAYWINANIWQLISRQHSESQGSWIVFNHDYGPTLAILIPTPAIFTHCKKIKVILSGTKFVELGVTLFLHKHNSGEDLQACHLVAVRAPHFVINHPRSTDELLISIH